MTSVSESFRLAFELLVRLDAHLLDIVLLSLRVSLTATAIATVVGLPMGAALAVGSFPGRAATVATLNALMGLPPVVMGLLVYLLLSRSGPLGALGLLFTPAAMVIAQALLITPIVAGRWRPVLVDAGGGDRRQRRSQRSGALARPRPVIEDAWGEYRDQLRSLRSGPLASALTLLWDTRHSLLTAVLAGFGRAVAEVGAVIIVGGNIDGVTRVMTTAIALETSKGDLPLALALGVILLAVVLLLNFGAYATREWARARFA
jgi:tungstate transport system permease protein